MFAEEGSLYVDSRRCLYIASDALCRPYRFYRADGRCIRVERQEQGIVVAIRPGARLKTASHVPGSAIPVIKIWWEKP